MREELKNKISDFRLSLDELYWKILMLKNTTYLYNSSENVRLAKAWLGEILNEMGFETPYLPVSSIDEIQPRTDEAVRKETQKDKTKLELINDYRTHLNDILEHLRLFGLELSETYDYLVMEHFKNAYSDLIRAKFFLGFEIGYMRDSEQ